MKEIIDFINLEICERRDYSASKAFEVVRDKIIKLMAKKKSKRGGARKGAGRKKKEPTEVIRVRKSIVEAVKKLNKEQ